MALVRIEWTETTAYEGSFEVDGYEVDHPEKLVEFLEELGDDAVKEAFVGCIDREVHEAVVVRPGELVAVVRTAPAHEPDWED